MGTQSLLDLADKRGEVGVGGGQEATSQEHLARQTIAEAPQDFLAHIGLEAIEGEYDTPLRRWRRRSRAVSWSERATSAS